jgi:hypothetical protein
MSTTPLSLSSIQTASMKFRGPKIHSDRPEKKALVHRPPPVSSVSYSQASRRGLKPWVFSISRREGGPRPALSSSRRAGADQVRGLFRFRSTPRLRGCAT